MRETVASKRTHPDRPTLRPGKKTKNAPLSRFFSKLLGEGEAVLLDIYSNLNADGAIRNGPLAGTAIRSTDGDVAYGPKRPLLMSQDVPVPVFDQMPLLSYQEVGRRA